MTLLDKMIYSLDTDTSVETSTVDPAVVLSAFSDLTFQDFLYNVLYAALIVVYFYMWVVLLFYILERRNVLSIRKFSFFKILTFGKLEAAEIPPLQLFISFILIHFIYFLIIFGLLQRFIIWILTTIIDLLEKYGGDSF